MGHLLTALDGVHFNTGNPTVEPSVGISNSSCADSDGAVNTVNIVQDNLFDVNNTNVTYPVCNTSIVDANENIFSEIRSIKSTRLFHINIRSLLSKFDEFSHIVVNNFLDIISVNETWLNGDICDTEISIDNFDLFRCDRDGRGGGVALYVRHNFKPTLVNDLLNNDLE